MGKKYINLLLVIILLVGGVSSCNYISDFSSIHNITTEEKDYTKDIAARLNCDYEIIENTKGPAQIMKKYKELLNEGKVKGYTPVIIIPSEILYEDFGSTQSGDDNNPESIIKSSETIDVQALLASLKEQSMSSFEEGYDIYGEFSNGESVNNFETLIDYNTNKIYQRMIIVKIPTERPWEVAAWIPMGGFNECPSPEEQVAIFKYWFEKYGSIPAVVTYETWELYVEKPIKSEEEAKSLAIEQFSFCNDIVTQGVGTVNSLAGTLVNSTVWYFWWD